MGKRKHNFVDGILIFIRILIQLGEQYIENVTYGLQCSHWFLFTQEQNGGDFLSPVQLYIP